MLARRTNRKRKRANKLSESTGTIEESEPQNRKEDQEEEDKGEDEKTKRMKVEETAGKEENEGVEAAKEEKKTKVKRGGGSGIMTTESFGSLNLSSNTFKAVQDMKFQHMTQVKS